MYSWNEAILNASSNQLGFLKLQQIDMPVFYLPELFFSSKKKARKVTY